MKSLVVIFVLLFGLTQFANAQAVPSPYESFQFEDADQLGAGSGDEIMAQEMFSEDQPVVPASSPACMDVVKARARQLAAKTAIGGIVTAVTGGATAGGLMMGYAYLVRNNWPWWIVNNMDPIIITQPMLAIAPLGRAAAGVWGLAAFATYEIVVVTKLLLVRDVLKTMKLSHNAKAKKLWIWSMGRRLKEGTFLAWDNGNKEEMLARAIARVETEGLLCNGALKKERVQKKIAKRLAKDKKPRLRHLVATKREILNFIAAHPEYLLAQ